MKKLAILLLVFMSSCTLQNNDTLKEQRIKVGDAIVNDSRTISITPFSLDGHEYVKVSSVSRRNNNNMEIIHMAECIKCKGVTNEDS